MANLQNGFYQVNLGTNPNDGTGDSFRDAFAAENYNFALLGNTNIANTTLDFYGSNITAPSGSNLNLRVSNGFVNLGAAGSGPGFSGNIVITGGSNNRFLRTDDAGIVYWSGGAAGMANQIQFNTAGAFDASPSLTYESATRTLRTDNMVTGTDVTVGRDLAVTRNAGIQGQLTSGSINVLGDATVRGNLIVYQSIIDANTQTIELNAFVLALANNVNAVSMLDTSGITWGNANLLPTADIPTIRFRDLSGTGNINQDLLNIYPGIWTGSAYFGANAPSNVANIRPGNINFGPDVTVTFESAIAAARFSNLQADVFSSPLANISQLNGNIVDLITTSDALGADTRLLKLRNLSTATGNVGLQIINQSLGTANIGWEIYSAGGNGTLTIAENSGANVATAANTRLQITREGNISAPYYPTTSASNSFIGFGPGNGAHAGLRYTGIDTTLSLEATGAIDQLQLNTGGTPRVTILGNTVPATVGFVGIGTAAPISPVQVLGSVDGNRLQSGVTVSRTGLFGGNFTLGVDNSNNQFFIADTATDTSRLVINSQGNVGLACTVPTVSLDVAGAGRFKTGRTGNSAALTLYGNQALDTVDLQFADSNATSVWAVSYRAHTEYDDLWFYQNALPNNPHLVLDEGVPRVGINTINPLANLHITSSGALGTAATIWAESTGGSLLEISAGPTSGTIGQRNNFPLSLQVNSINAMVINPISAGNTRFGVVANGNVYLGNSTSTGNISDGDTYIFGNGYFLSGIAAGNSTYGNATVADFLATGLTSNIVTTANVSGGYILGNGAFLTGISGGAGNYSNANVAAYLPTYGGNVGNGAGWIFGNGAFLTGVTAYTNANVFDYLGSNSNVNLITTGNVAANSYGGSTGNVRLSATTQTWTFDNTGNLILPANTFAVKYANGESVPLATGAYGNTQVQAYLESNAAVNVIIENNVVSAQVLPQGNVVNSANIGQANLYWNAGHIATLYLPAGNTGRSTVIQRNSSPEASGLTIGAVDPANAFVVTPANVEVGNLIAETLFTLGNIDTDGSVLSQNGYYGLDFAASLIGTANRAAGAVTGESAKLMWVSDISTATANTIGDFSGIADDSQLSQFVVDASGAYLQYNSDFNNDQTVNTWNYFANTKSTFPGNLYLGIFNDDGNAANVDTGNSYIFGNGSALTGVATWVGLPANATANGTPGQMAYAAGNSYLYVCTAANTWLRANLSTW